MYSSDSTVFVPCINPDNCPGGLGSTCLHHTTGSQCSKCEIGYFHSNGQCTLCSPTTSAPQIVLVIALLLLLGFYALLAVSSAYNWAGTGIAISFLQILGIFYKYPMNWPFIILSILGSFNFVNVDFDAGVGISCSFQLDFSQEMTILICVRHEIIFFFCFLLHLFFISINF